MLIFNMRGQGVEQHTIAFPVAGDFAVEIAEANHKQRVALGHSQVPGIWSLAATGILVGKWSDGALTHMVVTDITALGVDMPVVTQGDSVHDALGLPYGLDTLLDSDAARVVAAHSSYEQAAPVQLVAAEGQDHADSVPPAFSRRVIASYRGSCAFTKISATAAAGNGHEAIAVWVDAAVAEVDAPVSHGLCVSRTIGFCYASGLLAIGEDYEILRVEGMDAGVDLMLETLNQASRLYLPADQAEWPDLEAARRHRQRYGY